MNTTAEPATSSVIAAARTSTSARTGDTSRMPPAHSPPAGLSRPLVTGGIYSLYQPIVDLYSGEILGYEALARVPQNHPSKGPAQLFAAARAEGCLAEVDRACHDAAFAGALQAGLTDPWTLFINTEPETACSAFPADAHPTGTQAAELPRVIMELTERALTTDPLQLLQFVARIRRYGWGIALDDVGADPKSLALLPLLRPDVIKLDLRLVHQQPCSDIAAIMSAVTAEAERSGARVLAEGIETDHHRAVALSLGATLGQGWLLGRPAPLPHPLPRLPGQEIPIQTASSAAPATTPFEIGARRISPRAADKSLLIEISKHLESQATRSGESTVVLATFQSARHFDAAARRRYTRLVTSAAFVGALGTGMPAHPLPGVRGGDIASDDPLIHEWDVVVIGPHFAAALLARAIPDPADPHQDFEFILSHDRELAIAAAAHLIARISATSPAC